MTTAKQAKQTQTRRGWGRGTMEQRGPGTWVVRVSHDRDPNTDKRVRESRTIRGSRRDAERVLADLVRSREAHGATPTTGGKLTLDAWVNQHLQQADLSPRTRRDQLALWDRYSSPSLRATPLRDVTTAMLEHHLASLRARTSGHTGRKLAPRTLVLFLNVVRAALRTAVRQHVLPVNPALGIEVKGGSAVSKAGKALTADEVQRFLAHDPEDRLLPLWWTAIYTGVRPGELLALRWEDMDLEAAALRVRRALVRVGAEMYYAACKAGSEREVPLDPALVQVLHRHRGHQLEERIRLGGDKWVDPTLIFTSEIGSALDHDNVAKAFRRRLTAARIRPIRWYDLRHSFGSAMIASGVDPKTTSELMGHKDVTTTLRHYTHPTAESHRAAMGKLPWAGAEAG
jgi:integrase